VISDCGLRIGDCVPQTGSQYPALRVPILDCGLRTSDCRLRPATLHLWVGEGETAECLEHAEERGMGILPMIPITGGTPVPRGRLVEPERHAIILPWEDTEAGAGHTGKRNVPRESRAAGGTVLIPRSEIGKYSLRVLFPLCSEFIPPETDHCGLRIVDFRLQTPASETACPRPAPPASIPKSAICNPQSYGAGSATTTAFRPFAFAL